jgi:hypothetical protein
MTGDTIHPGFGMFAVDPGLKDPSGLLLMAGEAFANLFLCPTPARKEDKNQKDGQGHHFFQHTSPPFH